MGVVMLAGSFSLRDIVLAQRRIWFVVPQFAGFAVFLVAGAAEMRRLPFDLPEAENELVAGYHAEYSGMKFGMFYVGEYLGLTLISGLVVTLFFGGWLGPAFLPPFVWFFLKTGVLVAFFILVRGSLPRPRYDPADVVRVEGPSAARDREPARDRGGRAHLRSQGGP